MKIKLSDIASIAEIIAAIALVISLVFVGVQLQDNTKATKSASAIAASSGIAQWYMHMGHNGESAVIFRDFIATPDLLTPEEQHRGVLLLHSAMWGFQNNYYLVKEGTLEQRIQDSISQSIIIIKDTPGWKHYWLQRRSTFLPEYQRYVDELMTSDVSHNATKLFKNNDEAQP